MTQIHIIAGLLALLAGTVALTSTKGRALHRKSGTVFFGAMVVLTTSGFVTALFFKPNRGNVVIAALTCYLVCTALLTVRRGVEQMRGLTAALALLAFGVALRALYLGLEALGNPDGMIDKIPAQPLFLFAFVGLLGAALDVRLLWAGAIQGAHRLARHLWRMTFALWIATTSFFLGQAKFLPQPVRKIHFIVIPVLLVTLMLCYWLVRVYTNKGRTLSLQVRS